MPNPLNALHAAGQSAWLDFIRRSLVTSGELQRLITDDEICGLTSNPTIFEKAIGGSSDYDEALRGLLKNNPRSEVNDLYEQLAIADIQMAADLFKPVYEASKATDGFVSLEVSPLLANDTQGTIAEAKRLWAAVARPNLMIKVPGTKAGIPAIEAILAAGINVNVTLMFSLAHYEAVAAAYLRGAAQCKTPERLASVASFFVSRVDTNLDPTLTKLGTPEALALRGKIAIANCKVVYQKFGELFHGKPFKALKAKNAQVQRLLWASTSTKNPAYSDVMYVAELIGKATVNTVPPETITAFRDHGKAGLTLDQGLGDARQQLATLAKLGVDLNAVAEQLQAEGVKAFAASFDKLMATLKQKRDAMLKG